MSDDDDWIKVEKKSKKTKEENRTHRKISSSLEGRNFERGRPQTDLPNNDLSDDDEEDEDENVEDIVLESPITWNKFAMIGEVKSRIESLLMMHRIFRRSETQSLDTLINDHVGHWRLEHDMFELDLLRLSRSCGRQFCFISIIPRFTPREYGNGKKLFFVHVRYDNYFLADNKPIAVHNINDIDYYGFLGEKATHDPTSLPSDNLEHNKKNFMKIMKIVEGRMKHDKFQESMEQEQRKDNKKNYYDPLSKEDLEKYKNSIHKCKLHLEDSFSGFGIILDGNNLERKIYLNNRRNCFQAFNGDIVHIMVFQHLDINRNKTNRKKKQSISPEDDVWSGRVIEVVESEIKPVNKIFLCKLAFGNSNLMVPICKTIPVIEVDNKAAVDRVKKDCHDLIEGLRDVSGIDNLIQHQVKPENSKTFANRYFVTVKDLSENLETTLHRIEYVDCYRCDYIFLVLYKCWKSDSRFPFGDIVGLYTPDVSLTKTLPLISVSCDLSVVSAESEGELNSEIKNIKVDMKRKVEMDDEIKESGKSVFSFKYINQPFNEVAYSYQDMESNLFRLGMHIVNVESYIARNGLLNKYAMKQFYTFLLPFCQKVEEGVKPHYLYSEALTNFISIKKNQKVSVISFYFIVNKTNYLIQGHPKIVFEQLSLHEEFEVKIIDEMVQNNAIPYQYLTHVYETCINRRFKRLNSYCIPSSWFNPDYILKMDFCAFIISEEMDCLVNEFVAASLSSNINVHFPVNVERNILLEKNFSSWKDEVNESIPVRFCPTINSLFKNSITNSRITTMRFSRHVLDVISTNNKINLFKCDMLFPDVSYYFYKLENIVEWNMIMSVSEAQNKNFTISITKPLSCFNDLILQRVLRSHFNPDFISVYNENEIVDICYAYNENRKIFEKYWNICTAYDIRERFQKTSFILDCVYENATESSIFFHHPFLRNVYYDNFILFDCTGLTKVTLPIDFEADHVELEWTTKIFIYSEITDDYSNDVTMTLRDIYSYDKIIWRPNLFLQNITNHDLEVIDNIISEDNYPINLTSESSEYLDPEIRLIYKLKRKQILRIQFNYVYSGGIMKIAPELLLVNPHLKVCLCHRHDPFKYFMHPGALSKINYRRFLNLKDYKEQFRILNRIEGIHQTISEKQSFFIHDVEIDWIGCKKDNSTDNMDHVYGVVILDDAWVKERFIKIGHANLRIQDPVNALNKAVEHSKIDFVTCIQSYLHDKKLYWLGHANVEDVAYIKDGRTKKILITLQLLHSSFPMKPKVNQLYSLEIMETPITTRILDRNLRKLEPDSFVEDIVLKRIPNMPHTVQITVDYNLEVLSNMVLPYLMNERQQRALEIALNQKFSLIWGPPGTGKTMVGCIIAFAFTQIHKRIHGPNETVLYCGPSNQSVNVVAEKMMKTFGDKCPKLLRIFSSEVINNDFPYAGAVVNNKNSKSPAFIKDICLHYIIRENGKTYSQKLQKYDKYFKETMLRESISRKEYSKMVYKYQRVLKMAFLKEIKDGDYKIVLCTTVGACKKILDGLIITQVIIDESGMCSEPEVLGPLIKRDHLKNIIFIGDHKQLRPIVTSRAAQGKQFNLSLFERIYNPLKNYCTMLNKQYRMHPSICEFPSTFFYNEANSNLITALSENWSGIPSNFPLLPLTFNGLQYSELKGNYKAELIKNNVTVADDIWKGVRKSDFRCYPMYLDFSSSIPIKEKILFINVEGNELNQAVSGPTGGVKSKGNESEVLAVGRLYEKLVKRISNSKSILILTQYRLQEHLLKRKCSEILENLNLEGPPLVSTVIKSQGSECEYVIFSTVRSLPHRRDIDINPSPGWISKYLGFITDKNQFNVAITRAKKGLFIIGNTNLLSVNQYWKNMIDNLRSRDCVVENIFDVT